MRPLVRKGTEGLGQASQGQLSPAPPAPAAASKPGEEGGRPMGNAASSCQGCLVHGSHEPGQHFQGPGGADPIKSLLQKQKVRWERPLARRSQQGQDSRPSGLLEMRAGLQPGALRGRPRPELGAPAACCGAGAGVGSQGHRGRGCLSSACSVAPGTAGVGGSNMPLSHQQPDVGLQVCPA